MSYIVEFQQVTKRFGDVIALHEIELGVETGEFLSLLGPSGCGKTTLLRSCAGFETPTGGRVLLQGRDVTDQPPYKRSVNMVFQRWALFPHRTVAENIAFGLVIRKAGRAEIQEQVQKMLQLVKMEGYEGRYPRQLSGGQAQRVALARALVLKPSVLLLDEPLGSLDLKLRREMQLELIALHQRLGTTFIYVTHDQEEALTMSDRIVVMNRGTIIQQGTPTEIYQRPNSVFSAQFIGETVLFEGTIADMNLSHCRVNTHDCALLCPTRPNLRVGQPVTVCIRPERIRIGDPSGRSFENRLQGSVLNTIFKGPAVYYRVRLATGDLITVQQNLEQDVPLYQPGATINLSWSSENSVVLSQ